MSTVVAASIPTLEEFWEQYAPLIAGEVTERTAYAYANAMDKRVLPSLGHKPVDEITALDVRLAWASWSGSESTKVDARAALSRTLGIAVEAGLIAFNPVHRSAQRRRAALTPTSRALTVDEVQKFLEFTPEFFRPLIQVLVSTGLRFGEAAALTPADVDLDRQLIQVSRSLSPDSRGRLVVGDTKSHRARLVPIVPQLVPVLRAAMRGKAPHDLLFTGRNGGALYSGNVMRAIKFHEWRDQVKTFPPGQPPLKLHDLRHTALTLMARSGVPITDVQAVAGHSSLNVTQIYARGDEDSAFRVGQAYGRVLQNGHFG